MEILAIVTGVASIVLAGVAIWLTLHHKKELDRTNEVVRDVLLDIRSDAKSIAGVVLPELQKYGEAVRRTVFFEKTHAPAEAVAAKSIEVRAKGPGYASETLERFYEVVEAIHQGDRFTSKERDEAIVLARRLRDEGAFSEDAEFLLRLEELIDAFFAAGLHLHADALAEMFPEAVAANPGIVHTLLTSAGVRLLDSEEPSEKLVKRFERYERAAVQNQRGDVAVPFRLVHFSQIGATEELEALMGSLKDWEQLRLQELIEAIERRSDLGRSKDTRVKRVAEAHARFLEQHGERLRAMLDA